MVENKITDDVSNDDDNFADNLSFQHSVNNIIKVNDINQEMHQELIKSERSRRFWYSLSYLYVWLIIGSLYTLMVFWVSHNIKTTAWHTLLILGSMPTTLTIIVIKTLQPNHNKKDDKDEINFNSHAILETIKQQVSNITDILNKLINK